MKTEIIQQGDTLYFPVAEVPTKLEICEDKIIQHGEATGHAHRLEEGIVYLDKAIGTKYLYLATPSRVTHEEHNPIYLPPGAYRIGIVREKGMFDDLIAPVVD